MDIKEIIREENLVFRKTGLLTDKVLSYCPGCGHGTTHRIIMEVMEEMGHSGRDHWCGTGWMFSPCL